MSTKESKSLLSPYENSSAVIYRLLNQVNELTPEDVITSYEGLEEMPKEEQETLIGGVDSLVEWFNDHQDLCGKELKSECEKHSCTRDQDLSIILQSLTTEMVRELKKCLRKYVESKRGTSSKPSLDTTDTYTYYMSALTAATAADASESRVLNGDTRNMLQSLRLPKKTSKTLSTITGNVDGKSSTYLSEETTRPNYLVKLDLYQLDQIPPNVTVAEMWKYADVRIKYYGKTERGNVIPAQVNHLITTLTRSVQQQLEEKERQTMKRTVQVMAPSDDESVNSDQSDAEEFATPTTKEPLKKRMLFKKK